MVCPVHGGPPVQADVEIARMLALMKRKEKKLDLSGFLEVELLEYDQDDVRQLRHHHIGPVLTHFSALYDPTRAA